MTNIDDFIDEWHESDSGKALHEFLGMSWKEYALWVSKPYVLPYIVKARIENRDVEEILLESCDDFGMADNADLIADEKKSVA